MGFYDSIYSPERPFSLWSLVCLLSSTLGLARLTCRCSRQVKSEALGSRWWAAWPWTRTTSSGSWRPRALAGGDPMERPL